jgi:hypothetical protein
MAITRIGNIASTIPDDSIQNVKFSNIVNFKNIIINGDMNIAQRSTSVASITTSGYYTTDRYRLSLASLGTWTQSQSTDVPTGQGFAKSLKLDCTTADATPSSSDIILIQQKFEGQNLQYLKKGTASALSLTLSFWVKSTKTGTFIAELVDNDNAGSLVLNLWLGAGTDFTSGTLQTTWGSLVNANRAVGQVNIADDTSNDFYITGVQLEAGTTASDFEFLPVDVNLMRCKRYCQKYIDPHLVGVNNSGNLPSRVGMNLPVDMRTTPSASISGTFGFWDGGATQNYTTVSEFFLNSTSIQMDWSGSTFSVAGKTNIQYLSSGSNYILIDSEL